MSPTCAGSIFWAALIAIASQYGGHNLGSINPELYPQKDYLFNTVAIHDIKSGDNTYLTVNNLLCYSVTKGRVSPTGIGSPDAAILIQKMKNIVG